MRRVFGYSTYTNETELRSEVERMVNGLPIRSIDLRRERDSALLHVCVELDVAEDVERLRADVDAVVRSIAGSAEIVVTDTLPFADLSWPPFENRDISLGEYVELRGSNRYAVLWRLDGPVRFFAGECSAPYTDAPSPYEMGEDADLSTVVARVTRFILAGERGVQRGAVG